MAGDAEAFQKYVQKAMDALEKEMVENIYGSGSLFWRWNQETRPTDPPPPLRSDRLAGVLEVR